VLEAAGVAGAADSAGAGEVAGASVCAGEHSGTMVGVSVSRMPFRARAHSSSVTSPASLSSLSSDSLSFKERAVGAAGADGVGWSSCRRKRSAVVGREGRRLPARLGRVSNAAVTVEGDCGASLAGGVRGGFVDAVLRGDGPLVPAVLGLDVLDEAPNVERDFV